MLCVCTRRVFVSLPYWSAKQCDWLSLAGPALLPFPIFLFPGYDSVLDYPNDLRFMPILWKISPGIWEAEAISSSMILSWMEYFWHVVLSVSWRSSTVFQVFFYVFNGVNISLFFIPISALFFLRRRQGIIMVFLYHLNMTICSYSQIYGYSIVSQPFTIETSIAFIFKMPTAYPAWRICFPFDYCNPLLF